MKEIKNKEDIVDVMMGLKSMKEPRSEKNILETTRRKYYGTNIMEHLIAAARIMRIMPDDKYRKHRTAALGNGIMALCMVADSVGGKTAIRRLLKGAENFTAFPGIPLGGKRDTLARPKLPRR